MSSGTRKNLGALVTIAGVALGGVPGFLGGLGGTFLSYDGARRQQREQLKRARASAAQQAIRGNIRGSHEHHLMVFGKVRVGGIVVATRTEDGADMANQDLYISIAHSICHAGGCEGIEDIWIDDTRIDSSAITDTNSPLLSNGSGTVTSGDHADLVTVTFYNGTSGQATRKGIAWSEFKLRRPNNEEQFSEAYKFGIPTCTVELKGIRCYDPRLDTTEGGSGSQRHSDVTTWTWTDNPALCAATYMIMDESDAGMGIPPARVDWASVAAAANICDETESFGGSPSEPFTRYRCNGALLTADKRETNLQKLLDAMQGRRVRVGGQYKIYAGAYSTPTNAIDETWLAGPVKVTTRSPLEALYNAVRVNFDNSELNYLTTEAPPYTNATYESQDGDYRVWRDLNLPMVTNTRQAQYISHIVGHQSRQQMMLELTCNLKALDVEVWETATVDIPEIDLSGRVFRVMEWGFSSAGITMTLQEDASTVYDPESFQSQQTGSAPAVGKVAPPAPQNLNAAAVYDGIYLTWDAPPISVHDYIRVERAPDLGGSPSAAGTYKTIRILGAGASFFTDRVTDGATYWYRVRAYSKFSPASPYSNEATSTARTATTAVSTGADGVAVFDQLDTAGNQNVFLPVRAGFGMRVSRSEQ